MPDPTTDAARDPADARARDADARLIRDVRLRLVAWSGGTTLAVLLVLGVALYLIVARSLATDGTAQLDNRVGDVRDAVTRGGRDPQLGQVFGGRSSGTIAMLVDADGDKVVRRAPDPPVGFPDVDSIAAARDGGRDIRTASVQDVPVRILTESLDVGGREVYIQVVGDRSAEVRTLNAMLLVLVVGGGVVVLVAAGFGGIYARRALVPIRDSLGAQRAALRRQREFAADASHELRTPLTVIRSSVEHIRRQGGITDRGAREAIDDIDAEVGLLTSLVDDLLLLARSDSGAITLARAPVDVADIATEAAASLVKPAEARGVRLRVDPEPSIVDGDALRLRQLVVILVDNAIRHTPSGGEVRVRIRGDAREAVIEVEDDGAGIPGSDLPRVFERFYRGAAAPGGGTGLGLAIATSIVELHGGRIAVANRPPAGACFRVRLPAGPAGAPRPADAATPLARAGDEGR